MSDRIKIFFCEPTGDGLATETFECEKGHRTDIELGRMTSAAWDAKPFDREKTIACAQCGAPAKKQSGGFGRIFRRADTGEELGGARHLPAGAVFEGGYREGSDGRGLICVCPDGHHWFIDGRASNCTMKDDKVHRCWVRHGKPEDGTLHVDKNGNTCSAGAGSIQTPHWHGFLHHGELHA